jgi:hypothetical protein
MGLDTTHDAWHGPYSSFNQWRTEIASHIGINLREMDGYKMQGFRIIPGLPWDDWVDHDLYPLLIHSDCEGELTPDECRRIANALGEILPKMDPENEYLLRKTKQFHDGCQRAALLNQVIEFH